MWTEAEGKIILGLLALNFVAVPASAQACSIELVSMPRPVALFYEPFDGRPGTGVTSITMRSIDAYALDLTIRPHGNSDPSLTFDVIFEPSLKSVPILRLQDNSYRLDLPENEEITVEFTALISNAGVPAPGAVTLTYAVDAADAATGEVCLNETLIPVSIQVPSRAQMNLAGADSTFEAGRSFYSIDFGNLEPLKERNLVIQFRANADATLSVRSENAGRMVNSADAQFSVPYQVIINQTSLDLEGEVQIMLAPARTFLGSSLPLVVRLLEFEPVPAGNYNDTITLTIDAIG